MYDPQHPQSVDPLYRVGEELPSSVRYLSLYACFECLLLASELFGDSEDKATEVDTSEDPENGLYNFIGDLVPSLTFS